MILSLTFTLKVYIFVHIFVLKDLPIKIQMTLILLVCNFYIAIDSRTFSLPTKIVVI